MTNEWISPDGRIRMINADCLDVLPELEADCCITDPPFGIAFSSGWAGPHKGKQIAGDEDTQVRDAMLAQWGQKPALVFGTWKHPVVHASQAIVWDKGPASGMGDLSIPWKPSWELIFVCGKGFAGFRSEGIIYGHTMVTWASRGRIHPNQKPVGLLELLVKKSPGVIVDPFAGSATTAVACARLDRKCIAIERDPEYFAKGVKRLEAEYARTSLFDHAEVPA